MKWNIDFGDRPWRRWFAWYPIQLSYENSGRRAWLEWVERKTDNVQGYLIRHYRPL